MGRQSRLSLTIKILKMKTYYCRFEYIVTPLGDPEKNTRNGIQPYQEQDVIEIKSSKIPSESQIEQEVEEEWKRKKITNRTIWQVYSPIEREEY